MTEEEIEDLDSLMPRSWRENSLPRGIDAGVALELAGAAPRLIATVRLLRDEVSRLQSDIAGLKEDLQREEGIYI